MLKSVHTKIIIIFTVITMILTIGITTYYITNLKKIEMLGQNEQIEAVTQMSSKISQNGQLLLIYSIVSIIIIAVIIGLFVFKKVNNPIRNLIKNAKKIASGDETQEKYLTVVKGDPEVEELVNAFNMVTTELKQNLSEVNKQKQQIETILLHMTDGIIAFDMKGKIILVNPAATRLLKIMPEEENFEQIFEKVDKDINMEKIIYLENWTSSNQRVTVGERNINMFFAPFKDENDRPDGVMVVIQDITEHVKLDNMRKEFIADVSHELKTPITSIMGYADTLLEDEYERETQEKFLNVIATEARRMAKLVTDLLTLSRLDNNKVQVEKEKFDLGELVKKCQEKLQLEINKKNHQVECFVTANVPPVYADKYGIERVVLNILSNSIKYTKENGNIKIYVGFVYNDAYIKIIDNGLGIPEADLTRIFERFYRVDKARTREMGGTGLGLSIAKEILDNNNGSIDIKSEVGKGTEVVIRIPT